MGYFNLPFSVRISNDNPIDGDRYIATNLSARDQLVIDERAHVGLQVYVLDQNKLFILESLSPVSWKSSIDSAGGTMTGALVISEGGLVVDDDVSINGNLFVDGNSAFGGSVIINGSLYVTNVESIDVSTTYIKLNTGLVGAPPSSLQAGIIVERGSADPYIFVYDEDEQIFRIGIATLNTSTHYNDASTQAVATRQDNPEPNGILHWDASFFRMDTHPGFVYEVASGIGLPVANNMPSELTALMWDGAFVGSRDLGTMAFETSTNYYGKPEVDNQISTINASILNLKIMDSSLVFANTIQDASIVGLRNINLSQDASIIDLRNINLSQDASIIDLRNINLSQDASIIDLRNINLSQDASIENLRSTDLSLEASIARIDTSLNDTVDFSSLTYNQLYIDGSLATRDSSIIYLFDQIAQLDASIIRIDASLNDVVDAFGLFLPTASTGYGLAWNAGYLDVSLNISSPANAWNGLSKTIDGSIGLGGFLNTNTSINLNGTQIKILSPDDTTNLFINSGQFEVNIGAGAYLGSRLSMDSTGWNIWTYGPGGAGNYQRMTGSQYGINIDVSGGIFVTDSGQSGNKGLIAYQGNYTSSMIDDRQLPDIGWVKTYVANSSIGTGTTNYVPMWKAGGGLKDTSIYQINSSIYIGVTNGLTQIYSPRLIGQTLTNYFTFNGSVPEFQSNGTQMLALITTTGGPGLNISWVSGTNTLKFAGNTVYGGVGVPPNFMYSGAQQITAVNGNKGGDVYLQGGGNADPSYGGGDVIISGGLTGTVRTGKIKLYGLDSSTRSKLVYYDPDASTIGFGDPAAGVTSLSALIDVSISSLADQNLLQYDVVSGKWKNISSLDASTYFQKKVVYNSIPTTSSTGAAGDVVYDASYLYVCTSTNTWGRILLDYGF